MLSKINKELVVEAPQEIAFTVFTGQMDTWWPRTHHVGKHPMTEVIVEPKPNGRWYTKHEDGSEVTIGYLRDYKPFDELVLIWQIDGDFTCNPELETEVIVQFIPVSDTATRILFEHRNLDRMRSDGGKAIESMDQGWGMILQLYKSKAEQP